MAILNVTPDSFSDGGEFFDVDRAVERGLELVDGPADIVDLGAESTRPGATPVGAVEEQQRLLPVLEALRRERPQAILSVDTYHSSTARHALDSGAEIVNDVSGLEWDQEMKPLLAARACGLVLMHTRGTPQTWRSLPGLLPEQVTDVVLTELRDRLAAAESVGIGRDRIVIDPGFGFGKRGEENLHLLASFSEFAQMQRPLMAGISRKGFLREALSAACGGSYTAGSVAVLHATQAAQVAAILAGGHILRVHDPVAAAESAAIADRLLLCQ